MTYCGYKTPLERNDRRDRPTPAAVESRHREIARRYGRSEQGKPAADTWNKVRPNKRRKELRWLRHLLAKAGQSTAEIDAVIAHGGAPEMNALEIDTIYGFRFVFDHYKAIGAETGRHPSTLRPIDATKAEIDAYLKAFHRPRKAAAKRQRYAARRADEAARREAAADLDRRTSAISTVLTDDKWRSIAELMAALEHNLAFRRPNGKKFLTGDSLSKAIRRQLAKPDLAALIEITKTEGARGQDKLLIRLLRI